MFEHLDELEEHRRRIFTKVVLHQFTRHLSDSKKDFSTTVSRWIEDAASREAGDQQDGQDAD